jgi:tetratricopeptide (TPR) repeat protein
MQTGEFMLKPKRKVKKKDLKEDRFVRTTFQAKTYLEENYKQVVIVVIAIFAILILFILYRYKSTQTRKDANNLLGIAQIEFANQNYQKAIEKLNTIIEEYGGTEESQQGMFLLASIYYQQKKYDQAAELFEQFIDSYSGNDILISSAMAGLAGCYEIKKKFESAAELYLKAAKVADNFTESDNYRYLAGICYKKSGRIEDARIQFNRVIKNSKNDKIVKDSEMQLILLKK